MKKRYGKSKYAKMQQGGSVYDYMTSIGMDGSYKNRKAMFDDLFEGQYAGTAEQNIMLLRMLQNNEVPAMTREGAARRSVPKSTQNRRLGRNIVTAEDEVPRATQNRRLGRNIVSADEVMPEVPRNTQNRRLGRNIISQAEGQNMLPAIVAGYNDRVGNMQLPEDAPMYSRDPRNRRLGRNIISADEVEVPRNTRNRRLGRTRLQKGGPKFDIDPLWTYDPNAPVPYSPNTSPTGTSNKSLATAGNMMYTPGAPGDWKYANPYTDTNPQAQPDMDLWNTGMIMRGLTNVGAEIAGRVDRNRQNQYMQQQIANLGQQNPMPVGNYQPNRYALYARYGGKLQKGGKLEEANQLAKQFAINRRHINAEDTHTGGVLPKVSFNGIEIPYGSPLPASRSYGAVPRDATVFHYDDANRMAWYEDRNGDLVETDPSNMYLPQFQPKRNQFDPMLAATVNERSITSRKKRGGKLKYGR